MKLLPSAPSVKTQTKKISSKSISSGGKSGGHKGLVSVKSRVVKIEKLLGSQNKLYAKQKKKAQKVDEKKTRKKQESKLEKPKKGEESKEKKKLLKGPKLGFLDRIKSFIGKVLLGFIAVRMIDYLPQMIAFIPKIDAAATWIADFGIGVVDGFGSFVKGAYDLRDKTIGFIDELGGQDLVNKFKNFEGAVDTAITTIIFAAAAGGKGGIFDAVGDILGDRLMQQGAQRGVQAAATQAGGTAGGTAAQGAGIGAGAAAAIVGGAGLLASALGEGSFQLKKFGKGIESGAKKRWEEKHAWDPRKALDWAIWQGSRYLNFQLGVLGGLLDIVGAPFRYAIELIRYPFLNAEDKKKQATNLAKFDSRIRENLREGLNMLTGGLAFKEKGSFGNIYGNDKAQKEMMSKYSSGGITRGGQELGAISRSLKAETKTPRRVFLEKSKETKIKGGSQVGGEEKIKKIFPESKEKDTVSPLTYIQDVNKKVSTMPFLGPIFGIAYKTILGDKADDNDYTNIASGLDKWTRYTFDIKSGRMRMAGGGEVDVDMLMKGQNMTQALKKNVKGIISNKVMDALVDLRKQLGLKNMTSTSQDNTNIMDDLIGGIGGGTAEHNLAAFLSTLEASGNQNQADAFQVMLNRAADAQAGGSMKVHGNTLGDQITAREQFSPFSAAIYGVSADSAAASKYGPISRALGGSPAARKQKLFEIASQPDGLNKLQKLFGGGSASDAAKVLQDFKSGGPLSQRSAKDIKSMLSFRGYRSGAGDFNRGAGGNFFFGQGSKGIVGSLSQVSPGGLLADMTGKKKNIYLHWSGGDNMTPYPSRYHATFLADGSKRQKYGYNQMLSHTSDRNQGIGLAVAGMGHRGWGTMKKTAMNAMVEEAAKLAKSMGFSKSEVDRRIWTHAEAGAMRDGGRNRPDSRNKITPPPQADNYGPVKWGGDGARVDWFDVDRKSWGQGKGGYVLRNMIKNRMYYGGKVSGKRGQDMIPVMLTHGEFILDVDSTKALEDNFPGFLDALNHAKYDQAIGVLRAYASYESGAQQTAQIPMTIINNIIQSQNKKSGGVVVMSSGGSVDDYGEALAAGQ
jgi:hypothetical protein